MTLAFLKAMEARRRKYFAEKVDYQVFIWPSEYDAGRCPHCQGSGRAFQDAGASSSSAGASAGSLNVADASANKAASSIQECEPGEEQSNESEEEELASKPESPGSHIRTSVNTWLQQSAHTGADRRQQLTASQAETEWMQ